MRSGSALDTCQLNKALNFHIKVNKRAGKEIAIYSDCKIIIIKIKKQMKRCAEEQQHHVKELLEPLSGTLMETTRIDEWMDGQRRQTAAFTAELLGSFAEKQRRKDVSSS